MLRVFHMFAQRARKVLLSNPKIDYCQLCLRRSRDPEFVRRVVALDRDPDLVRFEHLGSLNSDKTIYLMSIDEHSKGFFSLLGLVLDGIAYARRMNFEPVVEFGPHTVLYDETFEAKNNPFEYYFEPVSAVSVEEARQSANVVFYHKAHRNRSASERYQTTVGYTYANDFDGYLAKQAAIYRGHIRLNPATKEYMDETISQMIREKKTLGVHVRGTDFNNNYLNHATAVSTEQYIEEIRRAQESCDFEQIFIATDEIGALEQIRAAFGEKIISYEDVFRSSDKRAVHFLPSDRAHHPYLLGMEVLRDMLTLSRCDGFIAGISNVSNAAQIARLAAGEDFGYKKIIDNGFNEYGPTYHYKKSERK